MFCLPSTVSSAGRLLTETLPGAFLRAKECGRWAGRWELRSARFSKLYAQGRHHRSRLRITNPTQYGDKNLEKLI